MSTLLLVAIGPVQEFIASARKLRDLWFGSYILSELSKTVAKSMHANGAFLIFPSVLDESELEPGTSFVVANKILAKVSSADEADRLQKEAHEAFVACMKKFGLEALNGLLGGHYSIKIDEKRFTSQLEDYGEFYAVWTNVTSAEEYCHARSRVEQLLASRKTLRSFQAPSWSGSGIPKNSLDGMRESVFFGNTPEIRGLLKKNEKLDAMGLIKRFFPLTNKKRFSRHFNDLADIAIMPWLEGIAQDPEAISLSSNFQDAFHPEVTRRSSSRIPVSSLPLHIESELFYAGFEELQNLLGASANNVWENRKNLVRRCGEPFLYGAILVGDGDHMGRIIDTIKTEEGHHTFGHELARFASEVKNDIDTAGGSLIYSGGDDVMAYLPLHRAISCADAIQKRFRSIMTQACRTAGMNDEPPTFSIGIAIVHHSMPLDQALALARQAEHLAKTEGERNALAITQSKRSGSDISVIGKWDDVGGLKGIAIRIAQIIDLYNSDESLLPSRLGYQLRDAKKAAGGDGILKFEQDSLAPLNAASALVRRIFDHKNDGDVAKNAKLRPLLAGRTDIRKLSDELVIARQIAEADRLAKGVARP